MALFKTRKTDVNRWCYVVLIFCCVFLAKLAGRAGRAVRGLLQKQSTSCCTPNSDGFWLVDGLFKSWRRACQAWDPKFLSYVVVVWWWLWWDSFRFIFKWKRRMNIKLLLTYCLSILFFWNLKTTTINFKQYNFVENNDHFTKFVMIWKSENKNFLKLELIEQTDFDFVNVFKNRIFLRFFLKALFCRFWITIVIDDIKILMSKIFSRNPMFIEKLNKSKFDVHNFWCENSSINWKNYNHRRKWTDNIKSISMNSEKKTLLMKKKPHYVILNKI